MLGCLSNSQSVGARRVGLRNGAQLVRRTCLMARMAETDIHEKMRNTTSSFSWVSVTTVISVKYRNEFQGVVDAVVGVEERAVVG